MNQRIFHVFLIGIAILASVVVVISVLAGGGNEIGRLAIYLSVACFLSGLFVSRPSMLILLFLAGYSDLFKRFMILGSSLSQFDLVYVLAMAPLTLAGVTLNVILGQITRRTATKGDVFRFFLCTAILAAVSASALLSGAGVKSLRVVADYGAFIYLIYVLPVLFPDRESLLRYAKVAVYVFIPVAIYGIWQRVYGLAGFELDYLETGLSIESRQLGQIGLRPFSTLNAATSLTIVTAACAMIVCILLKFRELNKLMGVALLVLFTTGCIMTFTRGGWVSLATFPFIVIAFRYKASTVFAYFSAIVTVVLVIYFSDWFIANLHNWQNEISGDQGTSTQAMKVTTLYDRFLGFSNLKNPDNWKAFGIEQRTYLHEFRYEDPAFSHDMVSRFIFKWGYVPTSIVLAGGSVLLWRAHRAILRQPMVERKATTLIVGATVALFVSVAAGSYIFQFPANIFLWIITCLSLSCFKDQTVLDSESESEGADDV